MFVIYTGLCGVFHSQGECGMFEGGAEGLSPGGLPHCGQQGQVSIDVRINLLQLALKDTCK